MKIDWENYDENATRIILYSKGISEMNWKGCPPGLTEIDLSNNQIREINFKDCPTGLTKIDLGNNKITEMNWEFCPPGLTVIILVHNEITEMNFKDCPVSLTRIHLDYNKITKMNWEFCPPGLTHIYLGSNQITEMNWKNSPTGLTEINLTRNFVTKMNWIGCPNGLTRINLGSNQITEMNWISCPPGLTEINLDYNRITEMNWIACPPGLTEINLDYNRITEMNWKNSPIGLTLVDLSFNKITKLNWVGVPNGLTTLKMYDNKIIAIPIKRTLKNIVKEKLFPLLYNYDSKSQKVCDLFNPLDKVELEYVANIYNIDKKLSRAKICDKLGTILQSYIKNKEENIDKCNNNETSIGGDDVKDIPSRRFFTYTQNDRVYCEDLEEFYEYIQTGGNKNPFTNIPLASEVIDYVKKEYKKLKMDVFQKYTEIVQGNYSADLANLLIKLHYPRNDDWYKSLSANEVINFIKSIPGISSELTTNVRTLDEIRQVGLQELVKFIEDDTVLPDKDTKKILVSQMWNGIILGRDIQ